MLLLNPTWSSREPDVEVITYTDCEVERLRKPRGDFENPNKLCVGFRYYSPTGFHVSRPLKTPRGIFKIPRGVSKIPRGIFKIPRGIFKIPRGVLVVQSVIPRHQTINVLPPSNEQTRFFFE